MHSLQTWLITLFILPTRTNRLSLHPRAFRIFCLSFLGESGIFVGKINPKRVLNDFCGYADRKASEQKILRDVFKKGDRVFNSG